MGYFVESDQEAVMWVPTIAVKTAPTVTELTAGDDITDDVVTINGFTARATVVEVATLKGGFTPKISGRETAEDSSLTFAEQNTFALNTTKALLVKGTDGYVVWSRYTKTPIATTRVDVFPSRIAGNNRTRTVDNRDAEYVVDFAVTAPPSIDATVAA